ncbi:uncharacterized protein TRIVIDRAFT_54879 [Trichoderma virens Gv29-8]|uniref:Uncharacterized protein n=1 Tax=Hypocrea virens (strain Gv29-8 / FGSC 10586) TaxID=413071 RepID=G9MIU9_HYPVG|nr:uncharacterized protein TRIVIDRAFT_54879 [Trichoderma virens Gv29-8]EHK25415.1 hypothetical protein TRIVIDRAFT_54879 [Trichoderma virens Gv29-8]UKZ48764.1 hypothetical protein TrVGV298_002994 [Trichoderma virens]
MCEVKLSICVHCGKIFAAKMKYCDPVKGKLLVTDSTPFEINSSFNWSPMEGCGGLRIHPTANLDACRNDISRPEVPFDRPTAARPSTRSPYPTPMALQRTDLREQLPPIAGMEEHQGVAMMPLDSDVQLQLQMQIQMQTETPTGDTPTVGSPSSSWSGSTVSYY